MSVARLLWKQEVLEILDTIGATYGVKTKRREFAYARLVSMLDNDTVQKTVREKLFNRQDWRADQPQLQYGG
jgi:hypothetical protein